MAGKCSTFWNNLDTVMVANPVQVARVVDVAAVVATLKNWRVGMEQYDPLDLMQLQADLVIFDVCNLIGLTEEERAEVMGKDALESALDEIANEAI